MLFVLSSATSERVDAIDKAVADLKAATAAHADAVDHVLVDEQNIIDDDPPAELRPCKHCGLIQPATRMLCGNCREVMP